MKKQVNIDYTRFDDQKKVMEQIIKDGACPFCVDIEKFNKNEIGVYHKKPIFKNGKYWLVTTNQWPYQNSKISLLLIYKFHAEKMSEIKEGAGEEFFEMLKWIEKNFNHTNCGGAFTTRIGVPKKSGATVKHLHTQYVMISKKGFKIKFSVKPIEK
ncbi:MAG: hypothetical protein WDK96_01810 [Candidatus Paceibacterota bacterium]|jgi:diadenosine tetraphosphate (Ap4A) HIT family hydrolase